MLREARRVNECYVKQLVINVDICLKVIIHSVWQYVILKYYKYTTAFMSM